MKDNPVLVRPDELADRLARYLAANQCSDGESLEFHWLKDKVRSFVIREGDVMAKLLNDIFESEKFSGDKKSEPEMVYLGGSGSISTGIASPKMVFDIKGSVGIGSVTNPIPYQVTRNGCEVIAVREEEDICVVCNRPTACAEFDNSAGEYSPISVCDECLLDVVQVISTVRTNKKGDGNE